MRARCVSVLGRTFRTYRWSRCSRGSLPGHISQGLTYACSARTLLCFATERRADFLGIWTSCLFWELPGTKNAAASAASMNFGCGRLGAPFGVRDHLQRV